MKKKTEQEITKVQDISREFVFDFYGAATKEDRKWIKESLEKYEKEKGPMKYFAAFRVEFANKFFPDIFKAKKKKSSLLDELNKTYKD